MCRKRRHNSSLGYDHVPTSYAEHKDAINKIIAAGLTDQAPIGEGLPTAAYVKNFAFRDIPVDEAEWAMHSSLGTASLSWEPTKKLLKRMNEENNAGWYSSEFDLDTNSGTGADQMQTDFINGKTYRYGGYMSASVDWLNAFYANNPDAELARADDHPVSACAPGDAGQDICSEKRASVQHDPARYSAWRFPGGPCV